MSDLHDEFDVSDCDTMRSIADLSAEVLRYSTVGEGRADRLARWILSNLAIDVLDDLDTYAVIENDEVIFHFGISDEEGVELSMSSHDARKIATALIVRAAELEAGQVVH